MIVNISFLSSHVSHISLPGPQQEQIVWWLGPLSLFSGTLTASSLLVSPSDTARRTALIFVQHWCKHWTIHCWHYSSPLFTSIGKTTREMGGEEMCGRDHHRILWWKVHLWSTQKEADLEPHSDLIYISVFCLYSFTEMNGFFSNLQSNIGHTCLHHCDQYYLPYAWPCCRVYKSQVKKTNLCPKDFATCILYTTDIRTNAKVCDFLHERLSQEAFLENKGDAFAPHTSCKTPQHITANFQATKWIKSHIVPQEENGRDHRHPKTLTVASN